MSAPRIRFSVLIPDGESSFALFVAHCLTRYPGVQVHVMSAERCAPIRFSRYRRTYTFAKNGLNDGIRLCAVEKTIKKCGIDVLLPTETNWLSFAAANREYLSRFVAVADVPDLQSLAIANNKWLLAEFLKEKGIPGPPTVLVTNDACFDRQLRELKFPVLLKPVSAWGGDGIERFDHLHDLRSFFERKGPAKLERQFIVQTIVPGSVVGINVLAREGRILAMTMQRGIIPNSQKYAAAGAIEFLWERSFEAAAGALISTLKWSGFANLDTLHDSRDGSLKILEINARFWGSLRGSLVAGVNFPYLACLAALGIPFEAPEYRLARYFHSITALREALLRVRGKAHAGKFALRETGIKYLLSDPLAEGLRAVQQQFDHKSSMAA